MVSHIRMMSKHDSMKLNSKITFILKCLISLILLYWLIQNGELSYKNIEVGLSNLKLVLFFLVLTFCQLFIGSIRTYFLMQFNAQGKYFRRILYITWASSFINCIAPSALFGEVFRIKELLTVDSNLNKDNTFYAIVFSKIFSILSLVAITVVSSLSVQSHPQEIQWFLYSLYIILISFASIYLFRKEFIFLLGPLFEKAHNLSNSQLIRQRFDNFKQYHLRLLENKKKVFLIILVSLGIQILNTISFLLIIYTINPDINSNILELTYVIPLGIIAMLLPVSISGIGVGHLAFSQLLGMFAITNGADIFTIYFAYSYLFNFIGLIPFLMVQKKMKNEY